MLSPAGSGLLELHFNRMAAQDPLKSDDDYGMSIAEACQFLSTLLVLYPITIVDPDPRRSTLIGKLKGWCKAYRGRFCEKTAQRCLDVLEPRGIAGGEMFLMLPFIKGQLSKGIETCNLKECTVGKGQDGKNLLQCGKYVVSMHQLLLAGKMFDL